MMKSSTILIASYDAPKITEAVSQFRKFTTDHNMKNPISTKIPKVALQIHGCDGNDLKKKSILIEGPLEKLMELPTVKMPKGVLLKFL